VPLHAVLTLVFLASSAQAATKSFPLCPVLPLSHYLQSATYECEFGELLRVEGNPFRFTVKDFSFSATDVNPSTGLPTGAPIATSDQILVTPAALLGEPFRFESPLFDIGPFQYVKYLFGFTVDPAPPIIPGFEAQLFTETPVFPGNATLTFQLCRGSKWMEGQSCPGGADDIYTLELFHTGLPAGNVLNQAVVFASPTNIVGVLAELVLDTRQGGTSQIAGFGGGASTHLPEPSTLLLCAAGLVALILRSRG